MTKLKPTICPICGELINEYLFIVHNFTVFRCPGCGIISNVSYEINKDFARMEETDEFSNGTVGLWTDSITEKDAVYGYLNLLENRGLSKKSNILLVSPPDHIFISLAQKAGWNVSQSITYDSLETTEIKNSFDAVVILYQLEKSNNPNKLLQKIYSLINPQGILMVITISLDSTSAHFFGQRWTEWRSENHYYFNQTTIQLLLWHSGFINLKIQKDRRKYTLSHINDRAKAFPKTWVTRTIKTLYKIIPSFFRDFRLRLPSSGIVVTAKRGELNNPQTCSIIIPAYNESKTFSTLMETIIAKELPCGIKKEIIVVESNSTDNTREQVLSFQNRSDVKIILQDKACGKGNAVRAGFKQAKGDIMFIQDADLEYDINDLDGLLIPIIKFQVPFVLGSRHGGKWKMREFEGEKSLSTFFNFGHFLFTSLINILYRQHMKDPFTMYKVFRRDCIHDLFFESNRFDFDFELVIKLIRKGYSPLEIPVNYRSRSYNEGKKVRVFQDPFTWIKALIKYRFTSIYDE